MKDVMCSTAAAAPAVARAPGGTGRAIVVYALCLEVVGVHAVALLARRAASEQVVEALGDVVIAPAVPHGLVILPTHCDKVLGN